MDASRKTTCTVGIAIAYAIGSTTSEYGIHDFSSVHADTARVLSRLLPAYAAVRPEAKDSRKLRAGAEALGADCREGSDPQDRLHRDRSIPGDALRDIGARHGQRLHSPVDGHASDGGRRGFRAIVAASKGSENQRAEASAARVDCRRILDGSSRSEAVARHDSRIFGVGLVDGLAAACVGNGPSLSRTAADSHVRRATRLRRDRRSAGRPKGHRGALVFSCRQRRYRQL